MQQILVYADSLSWGIIPGSRQRFPFTRRWPGVMEVELLKQGKPARVIEDCLNGRRTVWEDPFKPGRNGLIGLEQRIEINSPLALVVLLLGTNDFQSTHQFTAVHSAQGVASLIGAIRRAPLEPGMPEPQILVVAPPTIQKAKGSMAAKFLDAEKKSLGLDQALSQVAAGLNCAFCRAGDFTATSRVDGVHLDEDQHLALGRGLASKVVGLI